MARGWLKVLEGSELAGEVAIAGGHDRFEAHVVNGNEGFSRPLAELQILPPADDNQTQGHQSVISEFVDAIDSGRRPKTAGADNIKSLAMVFAAVESARMRRRQTIEALP